MAYIGICPDMCPEKERQERYGPSISIFERNQNNEPDIHAMVKEYRRSGADQREPEPEDLRTLRALELTTNYLINNIMDDERSKTRELEWYDFLWDRFRAIRKDITQQNICDQLSIMLVERCARFHVHSCYAMNGVKDFDVDMNKRNLNDCLQMLRQMYNDHKLSTGLVCEGELEFQKYDILLHLNDDHLSSTVQMKTCDYRSSDELKFIIKIFSAYTNNDNYTFFKLMEQADYMTSCVLSLCASKMRIDGLKKVINACAPRQATCYPVELLIKPLGFDDEHDLSDFANSLSINISEKDKKLHLILNKDLLRRLRESTLMPFKSRRLVSDKMRSESVGQLVYGHQKLSDRPTIILNSIAENKDMISYEPATMTNQVSNANQEFSFKSTLKRPLYDDDIEEDEHLKRRVRYSDQYEERKMVVDENKMIRTVKPVVDTKLDDIVDQNRDLYQDIEQVTNVLEPEQHPNSDKLCLPADLQEPQMPGFSAFTIEQESKPIYEANSMPEYVLADLNPQSKPEPQSESGAETEIEPDEKLQPVSQSESQSPDEMEKWCDERRVVMERIAYDMPAGFFKVRSLSSRMPLLKIPKEPNTLPPARVACKSPVTNQHKKLKAAASCIDEEKEFNKAIMQITKLFTQ